MASGLMPLESAQLSDFLVNQFGQDELEHLAFDLGVEYQLFDLQNKQKLALALVANFERRHCLGCLLDEVIRRRPINNLAHLLPKVSSCSPGTKIQITTHAGQEMVEDIEFFLVWLAQVHGLSREAVTLIAAAEDSLHLLLNLPETAALRLQGPGSGPPAFAFDATLFADLAERTQKTWRMIALEWPPVVVTTKLRPRISWQKAAEIFRLKEKDELLRRLVGGDRYGAHGTRTSLAALSGYAQLLALTAVPGEKQTSYIDKLVQAADDLSESLTVLYNLIGSREDTVTIHALLQFLLPSISPAVEQAGLELGLDLADGLSRSTQRIRCNLVLLTQAVGALVRHTVLLLQGYGRIQLSVCLAHDQLLLQVHDDGETLPVDEAKSVFEPQGQWSYLQAPNPAQVSGGLGLPLVKMVVQQMGGQIWYDSDSERGNTFSISFPLEE